jgi:uncharacterized protein YbjT (DUF2867 family)
MILVTGASGTVGSEVVTQLRKAGAPFRAAYHSEEKARKARESGVDAVVVDYDRPETLEAPLKGVGVLFLLSAGGVTQIAQEENALKAAKKAGLKHIVKLSAWGTETDSFSFAHIHRAGEKAIEASGLKWTFLRPNGFMQNVANYSGSTIKSQGAIYSSAADSKISAIDVRDIAAVAVKVLTTPSAHEGKAYPLSGPEALSNEEMARKLSAAIGKPVNYVPLSDADYKSGMLAAGIPADYADAILDLLAFYKRDGASRVTHDVKAITGRDPISFDQYARDNADAFR